MLSAQQALEQLRAGNRRFVAGIRSPAVQISESQRARLAEAQEPFAVILGCSDSRVPAEIVFDRAPGDLFVVRVAGNIAASSQVGSVEFAATQFGTRLVIVLGHSRCGAVLAALQELQQAQRPPSRHIRSILDQVRPSVAPVLETGLGDDPQALVQAAVRANIYATIARLRSESEILRGLIRHEGLHILGAEYGLETGEVEFFDEPEAISEG